MRPPALAHRHLLLRKVIFIGVTGSSGKTTTKELIALALASHGCTSSPGNWNNRLGIARSTLLARPNRRFHVQEVAIGRSAMPLEDSLPLVRPKIAVVTAIGADHLSLYGSMDGIAREKAKLVSALPTDGIAVLNADDPRVAAMAGLCRGQVVTYGCDESSIFRAEKVSADWPNRLSFVLVHKGCSYPVRTRLVGTVALGAVLAGIATAVVLDVPIEKAIERVEQAPPQPLRMEPLVRPDGVTFICDLAKAPLWHFDSTLEFLRRARAQRKVLIIGTISDFKAKSTPAYSRLAERALDTVDLVVFVGVNAARSRKASRHPGAARLHAFISREQTAAFLKCQLRAGDLVLIKGSAKVDDLRPLLDVRINPEATPVPTDLPEKPTKKVSVEEGPLLVVGLGNVRPDLRHTPHNIGWLAVEALAHTEGATWKSVPNGQIAPLAGNQVLLVKLDSNMNQSGPTLLALAAALGTSPTKCLILYDDLDLELGAVRIKEAGGDGGHRGLRSVILALGTTQIPRVRIGIGRSSTGLAANQHVRTPFAPDQLGAVDNACHRATELALKRIATAQAAVPA